MRALDPRRSLAAGAMWLIIGLAATFSIAAAVWVGGIARANVSEQHIRRLLARDRSAELRSWASARRPPRRHPRRRPHLADRHAARTARIARGVRRAHPRLSAVRLDCGCRSPTVGLSRRATRARRKRCAVARWYVAGIERTLARRHRELASPALPRALPSASTPDRHARRHGCAGARRSRAGRGRDRRAPELAAGTQSSRAAHRRIQSARRNSGLRPRPRRHAY